MGFSSAITAEDTTGHGRRHIVRVLREQQKYVDALCGRFFRVAHKAEFPPLTTGDDLVCKNCLRIYQRAARHEGGIRHGL